eukprot:g2707.t1
MVRVLMVAEKPSIADAIAGALCEGEKQTNKRAGVPIHLFQGSFRGVRASIVVTSVKGHLFCTDFPSNYQDRSATDPRTLFDAPTLKIPTSGGLVRSLQQLGTGIDHLVLWLDCDREGENICFEVIRVVKAGMRRKGENSIWRAHFSAITPKDIRDAMKSLGRPNENESLAVDARQELDLKVGVAWTRFQTRYFQAKYGKSARLVSYGPCQTPTLGFCVARHDRIKQFKAERYWRIESCVRVPLSKEEEEEVGVVAAKDNDDSAKRVRDPNEPIHLRWRRNRLFDELVTRAILDTVVETRIASVRRVTRKRVSKSPPVALNTVTMLKIASRALGMGPKDTMRVAEDLYLRGLTSYPRTETSQYPKHFDIVGTAEAMQDHTVYGPYARRLVSRWREDAGSSSSATTARVRRRGVDAGDHPPITPVGTCAGAHLGHRERKLYDMIVRHFLASVSPDCAYVRSEASFACGQELFDASGVEIIDPGYTELLPKSSPSAGSCPPLPASLRANQTFTLRARLASGETSPPAHIAEHELVSLMERHGVGTDASMATHISNIQTRNYVTVGPGRTLVPTEMGLTLVHGFLRIDPDLVLPRVRASIESECARIARGDASASDVLEHALDVFARKYEYFVSNIELMDSLFSMHYRPRLESNTDGFATSGVDGGAQTMSRCGACQTYMQYIALPPHRLFCRTCDLSYGLPTFGKVTALPGKYCPLDHFELVIHASGTAEKQRLCPRCYNDPPFEDAVVAHKGAGMTCSLCPHPSCESSYKRRIVCRCPSSANIPSFVATDTETIEDERRRRSRQCGGFLVLSRESDRSSTSKKKLKRWSLRCNACPLVISIHRVRTVTIASGKKRQCATCCAAILLVEFDEKVVAKQRPGLMSALKRNVRFGSEWGKYEGCVVCDDVLNAQTSLNTRLR